ncbi:MULTISPECIES: lipopolysaccharide biosynthesis protein [Kordiimonas]|jgi:O-antigen/teichoic acid export membrane protein|uniref:lipopolysaccharide biosynthesis protein n=1 Tax=Kordiimonas TaxID=288021 RepID=UPI002580899E|nr:lipopolysaccharide biosynthesis protein [Kordiimonas sp. UBA4487]
MDKTKPPSRPEKPERPKRPEQNEHRARVAGGAGFAFLGRMGALIEAVSVIAFTWYYGAATFGLFAVLWSYVKVSTAVSDAAMTTALQRFVPKANGNDPELAVGYAIKFSFLIAITIAALTCYFAPDLAGVISAAEDDADHLINVIRIYVWVLPFWTMVEVGTAAIRARRKFGPEIRVRVFYEQGLRLIAAIGFALMDYMTYGLFIAHLVSVVLSAALALRLVGKHYDFGKVLRAPMTGPMPRAMRQYGFTVMPANLIKKLFSEFPVMFLNYLLPGAAGAAAGGYYAVARKIASALQAVRMTFEYVMAPLAAEKDGHGDHVALQDMFAYATRLSVTLALPFGAALVLARNDILATMQPQFQTAAAAMSILCAGRVLEAATGPSSAIIEMLGHRSLPAINGVLGLITLLLLGNWLIPLYGVTGAAVAAATGLNVTAIAGLIETYFIFRLWPYDRHAIRPLIVSLVTSGIMLSLIPASNHWPVPVGILGAVAGLLISVMILVRYGLNHEDANALGRIGKLKPLKKLAP